GVIHICPHCQQYICRAEVPVAYSIIKVVIFSGKIRHKATAKHRRHIAGKHHPIGVKLLLLPCIIFRISSRKATVWFAV
ncbi:MAG: hypothetical protein IIV57_05915, partial [Bacteroidaceae bacterium]|nr:hypothetical protein [Bacteroidaceae bacterium]